MSKAVKKIISATAFYYGAAEMPLEVLEMQYRDLADLPEREVITAFEIYRRDPQNRRAPLPAQIRQIVCPKAAPIDEAREMAARIISSLSKFGHTNADRARNYIGTRGWDVVQRMGGWQFLCETVTNADLTIWQAQIRDLCAATSALQGVQTAARLVSNSEVRKLLSDSLAGKNLRDQKN